MKKIIPLLLMLAFTVAYAQGEVATPVDWVMVAAVFASWLTSPVTWVVRTRLGLDGLDVYKVNLFLNVIAKGFAMYFMGAYGRVGSQEALLTALGVTILGFGADQGMVSGYKRTTDKDSGKNG
jgi:hypothetical protein